MILGVSQWLSSKLAWKVGLIRVAFLVLVLAFGTGLALYLILWLVKLLSK